MPKNTSVGEVLSPALDYCYLNEELRLREHNERHRVRFLAVPKVLIGCGLSADAVLLYALMLERVQYSVDHRWADENGRVYIIFTAKEIRESLHCQSQKATELLKKLEHAGLIDIDSRTRGQANRFFVKRLPDDYAASVAEHQAQEDVDNRTGDLKIKSEAFRKSNANDTGKTDSDTLFLSSTKCNHLPPVDSSHLDEEKKTFAAERTMSSVKDAVMIPTAFENGRMGFRIVSGNSYAQEENTTENPVKSKTQDESVELIHEVLASFANREGWMARDQLRINQVEVPRAEIQKKLVSLTPPMIEYAAECMRRQKSRLKNPRSYALTALYNAPDTYPLYQSMLIKHENEGDWYRDLTANTSRFSARQRELAKQSGVA